MPFSIPKPSFLRRSSSSNSVSSSSKKNKTFTLPPPQPLALAQKQQLSKPAPLTLNHPKQRTNTTTSATPSASQADLSASTPVQKSVASPSTSTPFSDLAVTPPPGIMGSNSQNSNGGIPASPRSRQLSDRARAAPSSLVRQLRSYSHSISSFTYESTDHSMNKTKTLTPSNSGRFTISGLELLQQNKAALSGLPPQLAPVVTLINAQKLRTYAIGTFQVPGIDEFNNRVWIEVEGKLTGNELAIWRPSEEAFLVDAADEFKPRYINLTDVKLEWGNRKVQDYDLKISQTFKESFLIKFNDPQDLHIWSAAICLSNFEFTSLNEAFTAVILSLKGKELSDIHILLSKQKRFPKSEWCNIRIPQISSKWIKVFVCIIPLDGKKKNGRIEMYLNDKMNKKNLILYVNRLHDIYNVYPEQPNMIDLNAIMKLDGEVYINKSYEPLFEHDQLWTTTLSQPPSRASSFAFKAHSRSGSLSSIGSNHNGSTMRTLSHTSTNSFFTNAPSPTKESFQIHTNTTPNSNSGLSSNFFKKEAQLFAITNCLYLMPVQHPGVPVIETMIRNFIEIIDAFKLYGRPEHLASDKFDTKSMLFGLPSLPRYKYLSMSEAVEIVKKSHKLAIKENWEGYDWRYVFKTYINNKQKETGFKGHGDILRLYKTFDTLQLDDYDYVIGDGFGNSPKLNLSESKPLSRDLLIELYNQDDGTETILLPSDEFSNQLDSGFNSIDNSRTNSGLADSPSDFNETIEFGAQLRAAAAKVKSSDHPYYNIVGGQTTSNEFANPISSSPLASSPFHSSPLRPKV